MGLSQLAPNHFKTLYDHKFSNSYALSLPLHDASQLFYSIKWSHRSPQTFKHVRGNTWGFKLLQWVSRTFTNICTMLQNIVLTCKRRVLHKFLRSQLRWFAPLYACIVWPWECCKTCRIWSCNVVPPLHVTCPIVYIQASYRPDLTFMRELYGSCCTNTSSPDGEALRNWPVYIPPSSRASTCMMVRMIVCSPYVQSH